MGAGKTNYAVNELFKDTKYKRLICNIPLTEDFKKQYPDVEFIIYDKYDVESVVKAVNPENSNSFIIIDEAQLVLQFKTKAICKAFNNACTRIRQDNQIVILITQTSDFLDEGLRKIIYQSFKLESQKQKSKSLEKVSFVKIYNGGTDYETKKIETKLFKHVYGNYESENFEPTEKPKVVMNKTKTIIILCFIVFIISAFITVKSCVSAKTQLMDRSKLGKKKEPKKEVITEVLPAQQQQNLQEIQNILSVDTICIRSYLLKENGVIYAIDSLGYQKIYTLSSFPSVRKCPI